LSKPLRKLTINGEGITPKQASELPNSASYPAITKRMRERPELSDSEIVFLPMMSASARGKRGAKNTSFNGGAKKW